MRTLLFILQKEFLQIFRNRAMLPIIFVMPVIQLIVLGNAATFEVREIQMSVTDHDRSSTSRRLVEKMVASGYFAVAEYTEDGSRAGDALLSGDASMLLQIPGHFERDLQRLGTATIQLIFDAQDGATAGVANAYAASTIASFDREIAIERLETVSSAQTARITVIPASWYNPNLDYQTYMVPGILVVLVSMIATFLSSMNVVREKEIGTIEQLNVTPIRKYQFITGKLLPFWVIALLELGFGLVIAELLFDVPILGGLPLVFGLAGIYLLVMLGIGLWISTITETQQQAMFLAWFFMVVFILMSGLFTPIESMPVWAQNITLLNPVAHFIKIMRRVMLKGADFEAVITEFWALSAFAVVFLSLAVRQYRKVSA